jgi:uncharacterized membrane protein HdeD (DUF308 family)
MLEILTRNWWALALRGIAAILLGMLTILWPGITLPLLVLFFAAYLLVDGVFAIIAGVRAAQQHERWSLLVVEGALDLLVGGIAFIWPNIALLSFIYLIALWAILTGIALLVAALRLHRAGGEATLAIGGLVSLLWGVLVVAWPKAGEIAVALWIGVYALLFGVFMLTFALSLRRRS